MNRVCSETPCTSFSHSKRRLYSYFYHTSEHVVSPASGWHNIRRVKNREKISGRSIVRDFINFSTYLHWNVAQKMPALRAMVKLSEFSVKYVPCPVHMMAAPNPIIADTTYKTHVRGKRKEPIYILERKKKSKLKWFYLTKSNLSFFHWQIKSDQNFDLVRYSKKSFIFILQNQIPISIFLWRKVNILKLYNFLFQRYL